MSYVLVSFNLAFGICSLKYNHKVFYTYGPNLVILAWTGVELSRGQTWWRTDGRGQRQYPEANSGFG